MVTIQHCPNHIACGTFEEGGEAVKLDFEEQGSMRICGVECQVISPAPPVEKVLMYNYPYENNDSPVRRVFLIMARSRAFLTRRGLASRVSTRVPG